MQLASFVVLYMHRAGCLAVLTSAADCVCGVLDFTCGVLDGTA